MKCRCGHELQQHSDRAIFPPCEGAHQDGGPLYVVVNEDLPFNVGGYVRHAPMSRAAACECKGFNADGV